MEQALLALIPVIPIAVAGVWALGHTAIGKAIARRIEGKPPVENHAVEALHDEVMRLRDEVQSLREEQLETNERIDFTERMLTKGQRHDLSEAP